MLLSIITGLVVSIDALFIGMSLGLQEECKFSYLVLINTLLLGLCLLGYFIAGQVYELIPVDPDYIVGFSFITLGIFYIASHFVKANREQGLVKKERKGTFAMIGLVMGLEAMVITMGVTFVFILEATLLIPIMVTLAHFGYSVATFFLARTKQAKKLPVTLTHLLSGLGLIVYGLLALFVEIEF